MTRQSSSVSSEAVKAASKVVEKAVTKYDYIREFGEQGYSENADGSWNYSLPTKDGYVEPHVIARHEEMDRPRMMAEAAACDVAAQMIHTEKVRRHDGVEIDVHAAMAEDKDKEFHQLKGGRSFGYSRRYSSAPYWRDK